MIDERAIVLPDTLVAQLVRNAATVSEQLKRDFAEVASQREALRSKLIDDGRIYKVEIDKRPLDQTYAIDGAHLAEIDRASAYSVSCAVRVGQSYKPNDQSSCLAVLPHVPSLNAISSSLMMMQEIMMTVNTANEFPDAVCLIDGSKISAIININQFYTTITSDLPNQLDCWRQQGISEPEREPGRTLSLFESKDWIGKYLTNNRIVGNLKLVTTTVLVEKYAPTWIGRFDDKTLAALVLEGGEALGPIEFFTSFEPRGLSHDFPYWETIHSLANQMTQRNHANQILHLYYRPDAAHGVSKIETTSTFLSNPQLPGQLFAWWCIESASPDMQEPYSFYIADRFAKQAVSVSKNALKEIVKRDSANTSWAWFFTQPYRTE